MTRLSLDSYIREARGIGLTESKDTKENRVDVGTLGSSIATFFTQIGASLGVPFDYRQEEQSKARWTESALQGFREGLRDRFGEDVANYALLYTGLGDGQGATKLTGKQVIQAENISKRLVSGNCESNREVMEKCLPLRPHEDPKTHPMWESICTKLNLKIDPLNIKNRLLFDAYEERLVRALRTHSEGGRKALTEAECEEIATRILQQVSELHESGDLHRAQNARRDLRDSVERLYVDIGNESSPDRVFERLQTVQRKVEESLEAEGLTDSEDVDSLRDEMMREAIRDIVGFEFWDNDSSKERLEGKSVERLLNTDSPVRALYTAMAGYVTQGSEHQQRDAKALQSILETLVHSRATLRAPHTESRDGDVLRLGEDDVDRDTLQKSRQSIGAYFDSRLTDSSGVRPFLEEIRQKDEAYKNGRQVLVDLERSVDRHTTTRQVSLSQGYEDYRTSIEDDETLSEGTKRKLIGGLQALPSGERLGGVIEKTSELRNLNPDDTWRLMAPGGGLDPNGSAWDLEVEPGARARIQDTLALALDGRGTPLSVDDLERLYKAGDREGLPPMSEAAKQKAGEILQTYTEQIGKAGSDEQKLEVIANTVRALIEQNVFETDGTRTVVVGLMNRLLVDNQLDLCVLDDPDNAPSQDDFVARIRDGQQRFRTLVDPGRAYLRRIEEGVTGLREHTEPPRWTEEALRTQVLSMVEQCARSEKLTVSQAAQIVRDAVQQDPDLSDTVKQKLGELLDYGGNPGRLIMSGIVDDYTITNHGSEPPWDEKDEGAGLQDEVKRRIQQLVDDGLSRQDVCDALEKMANGGFHAPIVAAARDRILKALEEARQEPQPPQG